MTAVSPVYGGYMTVTNQYPTPTQAKVINSSAGAVAIGATAGAASVPITGAGVLESAAAGGLVDGIHKAADHVCNLSGAAQKGLC